VGDGIARFELVHPHVRARKIDDEAVVLLVDDKRPRRLGDDVCLAACGDPVTPRQKVDAVVRAFCPHGLGEVDVHVAQALTATRSAG
jgi:hypothetical protein